MKHRHVPNPSGPQGPIVMTLDAGGTHFVFSAIRDSRECVPPITHPSHGHDLKRCLQTILQGFEETRRVLDTVPAAISFAFPGPADYAGGIIGDLGNLPAFRGGVPLGPMLEDHFGLPVFINNDGDLFAYGEAMHGFLPELNRRLEAAGSRRRFRNLVGVTLGTGFGGGLVGRHEPYLGDNGAGAEVWLLRNSLNPGSFSEENISARAVVREYMGLAGGDENGMTPLQVYQVATGHLPGNRQAATESFDRLGQALGDALGDVITLCDAPVVIGGGLAGAWELFAPAMIRKLNGSLRSLGGQAVPRLEVQVVDLEDPLGFGRLAEETSRLVRVPFSDRTVTYDPVKKVGLGRSRLGASKAIALGAYAFALHKTGYRDPALFPDDPAAGPSDANH